MKANVFSGHCFFILFWLSGWLKANQPHLLLLLYGHISRTLIFFLSLFVTFKVPCIIVRTITFFSPDFYQSMILNQCYSYHFAWKWQTSLHDSSPLSVLLVYPFCRDASFQQSLLFFLTPTLLRILTWNINPSKCHFPQWYCALKSHC